MDFCFGIHFWMEFLMLLPTLLTLPPSVNPLTETTRKNASTDSPSLHSRSSDSNLRLYSQYSQSDFTISKAITLPLQVEECDRFVSSSNTFKNIKADFLILSPNYPGYYFNNSDCVRLLQAPELTDRISVEWDQFHVEYAPGCTSDYIEVRDGPFGYSPLIGRFCDHYKHKKKVIRSSGPYLWLWFHSDATLSNRGFVGRGTIVKEPREKTFPLCHMSITLNSNEIMLNRDEILRHLTNTLYTNSTLTNNLSTTVRNSTSHILHNENMPLDCSFEVVTKYPIQIYLDFPSIRFPSKNENCEKTRLEWYDGVSYAHRNHTLCSKRHKHPFVTTHSRSLLRFHTQHMTDLLNFTVLFNMILQANTTTACSSSPSSSSFSPSSSKWFNCGSGTKEQYCIDGDLVCNNYTNCPNGTDEFCQNGTYVGAKQSETPLKTTITPIPNKQDEEALGVHYGILAGIMLLFSLLTTICCLITVRRKRLEERQRKSVCIPVTSGTESPYGKVGQLDPTLQRRLMYREEPTSSSLLSSAWRSRELSCEAPFPHATTADNLPHLGLQAAASNGVPHSTFRGHSSHPVDPVNNQSLPHQRSITPQTAPPSSRPKGGGPHATRELQSRIGRYLAVQNPVPGGEFRRMLPHSSKSSELPSGSFAASPRNHLLVSPDTSQQLSGEVFLFSPNMGPRGYEGRPMVVRSMEVPDARVGRAAFDVISPLGNHSTTTPYPTPWGSSFHQLHPPPIIHPIHQRSTVPPAVMEMKRVQSCGPTTFNQPEPSSGRYLDPPRTSRCPPLDYSISTVAPAGCPRRVSSPPDCRSISTAKSLPNFREEPCTVRSPPGHPMFVELPQEDMWPPGRNPYHSRYEDTVFTSQDSETGSNQVGSNQLHQRVARHLPRQRHAIYPEDSSNMEQLHVEPLVTVRRYHPFAATSSFRRGLPAASSTSPVAQEFQA